MDSNGGASEEDVRVSASITFQSEGRVAESALQRWRRTMLENNQRVVDETQSCINSGVQDWATSFDSAERAAAKSRRVTIRGGQIVQGSQRNPPIKLPKVARIPPYTFWTLAVRNVKLLEQSAKPGLVFGEGGEATILHAEDEEDMEGGWEESRHPEATLFGEVEDHQIWATCQKHGTGGAVLDTLARLLLHAKDRKKKNPTEEEVKMIESRYKSFGLAGPSLRIQPRGGQLASGTRGGAELPLGGRENTPEVCSSGNGGENGPQVGMGPEGEPRHIEAGLDTVDKTFCRRCYRMDCPLHGICQARLYPVANQMSAPAPPTTGLEIGQPCSPTCYLHANRAARLVQGDERLAHGLAQLQLSSSERLGEVGKEQQDDVGGQIEKAVGAQGAGERGLAGQEAGRQAGGGNSEQAGQSGGVEGGAREAGGVSSSGDAQSMTAQERAREGRAKESGAPLGPRGDPGPCGSERGPDEWSQFQLDLYEQGLRMYGEQGSCCRIARLLRGSRTCADVAQRLERLGRPAAKDSEGGALAAAADSNPKSAGRKRKRAGDAKKLNWLQTRLRTLNEKKLQAEGDPHGRLRLKAYTPCACAEECGAECPCQQAPTLCEKYCACPKSCQFKAVGCKCTSACTTRACPCLASDRECDPDLCHGCMVSCGHPSSLGVPEPNPHRRSEPGAPLDRCQNMKLQQRRHKKILLGPSAVAGWGAFVCGGAAAGELLGEYTGELVNDQEAEARGRVYDANNKSFLFQLNDQFILDACHKGDKLKFANHSPKPNCQPKVMSVLGDHRVAIHVDRNMESGEEVFYDYNYSETQAPDWALTEADMKRREREMQEARGATKKGTRK